MKYQRFSSSGCTDIGIRISGFAAKTQLLYLFFIIFHVSQIDDGNKMNLKPIITGLFLPVVKIFKSLLHPVSYKQAKLV